LVVAPKTVLVAESDEVVLVLISHVLSRQSYVVQRSATAAETELLLQSGMYDAVLLAPRLADADDCFLKRLATNNPELSRKLIVLAANTDDEKDCQSLGVYRVMRKPVEIYDLIDTVRRCVSGN
jgi:DNA-binding NtrC family response regulator